MVKKMRDSLKSTIEALAALTAVVAIGLVLAWVLRFSFAGPSPEAYAALTGSAARLIPAGELAFGSENLSCGRYPTVFNPAFSDYGAAFFGFTVLNPDRFRLLPPSMKRFAYAHECGHQYVGYSELGADCYAVKRGLAQGWLDPASLEDVCAFFSKSKGTALHLPGPQRCAAIRVCYRRQGGGS